MQRQPEAITIEAEPLPVTIDPSRTALVMIDFQRDFLERGGYGEALGNDVSLLQPAIDPAKRVLAMARARAMKVIHTREGHKPDLSDCPHTKLERWPEGNRIGDMGPMGRILIRGEKGHAIIDELAPLPGEPVIDKSGKCAFIGTDLKSILDEAHIRYILFAGVTTNICASSTIGVANDLDFDPIVIGDAMASYNPDWHRVSLETIKGQGGIWGWVTDSKKLLKALG